jgi:2-C-methyl-D-erythritol 2,4-cyclodiphosphate synthase
MRVGHGYDSHRFDAARPLVLGGVHVAEHAGLSGHSDGDAVCHAVTDALLGAAGQGNIGSHFPPDDDRWKDADSVDLLRRVVEVLERANYQVVNVDVTVICELPRIGPIAPAMRSRLGEVLRIGPDLVSIKGKSNEGMGWIGAGEGIAVHAVALIDRRDDHDRARS